MTLPTFAQERRIDVVNALNELSEAADAAIAQGAGGVSKEYVDAQITGVEAHLGAFETEAVTKAEGANAIEAAVAQGDGGATLSVKLNYGTGLAVQNGKLVATGGGAGGEVTRLDVIDIVKQALQSATVDASGNLSFTLPD